MINPIFKEYEFLYNYFETLLKSNKRFPQSIVFEGLSTLNQYFFTLELARILNCTGDKTKECNCINCRWIRENKHPAVVSVNQLEFKEDSAKEVISVKQTEKIVSMITKTSEYHRFFIFSGAKEISLNLNEKKLIETYEKEGYFYGKENFVLTPLNRKILHEESSNSLLKSIEEAPDRVTFIFLTDTRDNILQTILSRSLIFKMPYKYQRNNVPVDNFFENYPVIPLNLVFDLISNLTELAEEYEFDSVLTSIQEKLTDMIKINSFDINLLKTDIKSVQTAKNMIKAKVMPKYALEYMLLSMTKEGRFNET